MPRTRSVLGSMACTTRELTLDTTPFSLGLISIWEKRGCATIYSWLVFAIGTKGDLLVPVQKSGTCEDPLVPVEKFRHTWGTL